jgi:hypothetical protein
MGSLLPPVQPEIGVRSRLLSKGLLPPTTTSATASTTAATTSPATATTATTTVAGHFVEARIDLLLGLCENLDEITSLLGV